jgi:hypothetical protein
MTSDAKPGLTQITVALRADTPPSAVSQVGYEARKKMGDIAHTLPQRVRGPFFNDEFGYTFGTCRHTGIGSSTRRRKSTRSCAMSSARSPAAAPARRRSSRTRTSTTTARR